jgi:hypothetical protein
MSLFFFEQFTARETLAVVLYYINIGEKVRNTNHRYTNPKEGASEEARGGGQIKKQLILAEKIYNRRENRLLERSHSMSL